MRLDRTTSSFVLVLVGSTLSAGSALAQDVADAIYSGGPILTMDDAAPRAEAVAVRDGRILAVGAASEMDVLRGPGTETVDLAGHAMLPGFFDSHGHVMVGGLQALSANPLAPPDGEVSDIASLQATLRSWAADNADKVDAADVIVGFGYDNSQLAELRHPTRADLDAVSSEVPVVIIHQSGHIGAANSLAL